jgi:hypothetical protein
MVPDETLAAPTRRNADPPVYLPDMSCIVGCNAAAMKLAIAPLSGQSAG